MASNESKHSLEELSIRPTEESDTDSDAGANLRSPKDKARREKIISNRKYLANKTKPLQSLQLCHSMYSSTFQNTLDHFSASNDAFEFQQDTTLFNFPQKPIEKEVLQREEVEIEQRANRKRKETIDTQSFDGGDSKIRCTEELMFDLTEKFPPCFQRINVGEEGAAGVCNLIRLYKNMLRCSQNNEKC